MSGTQERYFTTYTVVLAIVVDKSKNGQIAKYLCSMYISYMHVYFSTQGETNMFHPFTFCEPTRAVPTREVKTVYKSCLIARSFLVFTF